MTSDLEMNSTTRNHLFGTFFHPSLAATLAVAALAALIVSTEGCAGGARPYRAMAKAAQSELSAPTLARDQRLKIQLREAIVVDQTYEGLVISPHVYMERGFVVGFVDTAEQKENVLRAARTVQGLRSLYGHLPVRGGESQQEKPTSDTVSDLTIAAEVKASLALVPEIVSSQIDIEVLAGEVVLLGVVGSEEVKDAAEGETRRVAGVTGVTNLLLLPEAEYMKRRPSLLR